MMNDLNSLNDLRYWEPVRYFPKHEKRTTADGAHGYRFNPVTRGNGLMNGGWYKVPAVRMEPETRKHGKASWEKSPQVKLRMGEPEKKSLWKRVNEWMLK